MSKLQSDDEYVSVKPHVEEKLQHFKDNLKNYILPIRGPKGEDSITIRRRTFCQIPCHRKGNDKPEIEENHMWYAISVIMPFLMTKFQDGDYTRVETPNRKYFYLKKFFFHILTIKTYFLVLYDDNERKKANDLYEESGKTYYVRLCDDECPILTDVLLKAMESQIEKLLKLINKKKYEKAFDELQKGYMETEGMTLIKIVYRYYKCFSGFRTIYNYLTNIRHCLFFLLNGNRGTQYPQFITDLINRYSPVAEGPEHLTQMGMEKRWKNEIVKYESEKKKLMETETCDVCERYRSDNEMATFNLANKDRYVFQKILPLIPTELSKKAHFRACRQCRNSLNNKTKINGISQPDPKMPKFAVRNKMEFQDLDELNRLNFVGKNVVQRVKPIVGM